MKVCAADGEPTEEEPEIEPDVTGAASESDEDTGSASACASRLSKSDLLINSNGGRRGRMVDARMGSYSTQ